MKHSTLIYVPVLFSSALAAPQGSSVCNQVPQNPAAGQIAAQYLQIPGCGNGPDVDTKSEAVKEIKSHSNGTSGSTSGSGSIAAAKQQQPSTNATASGSTGGKCPAGFRNTVFNTGAARNAGWPQTTWNSLTANGVSDWSKSNNFLLDIFSIRVQSSLC